MVRFSGGVAHYLTRRYAEIYRFVCDFKNMKCIGLNKNWKRCKNAPSKWLLCHHHRKQPLKFISYLVFTVLAGAVSVLSYFEIKPPLLESPNVMSSRIGEDVLFLSNDIDIPSTKDWTKYIDFSIKVQALRENVRLLKKGSITNQNINTRHLKGSTLFEPKVNFYPRIELVGIYPEKILLNNNKESSLKVSLRLNEFLPDDFHTTENSKKYKLGNIELEIFYIVNEGERSKIISIPVFFGTSA